MSLDKLPLKVTPNPLYNAEEPHYIEPENPSGFKYQSPLAASSNLSPHPSPQSSPSSNRGSSSTSPNAAGPTSPSRLASPGAYFCQICAKKFNSDKTFNAHLVSAAHQSRTRQAGAPTSKRPKNQRSDEPRVESSDDTSDSESSSLTSSAEYPQDDDEDDKDENLARAVTMTGSATRIIQAMGNNKQPINISELDKAYRLFLQAAKLYNQIWNLKDAAQSYNQVLEIQKQLMFAKANPGVSSKRAQASPTTSFSLHDVSKPKADSSTIDASLLAHTMVLLKVNLYVGRLLRAVQPLQSLQYFEATMERIINLSALPRLSAGSPPSPSTIREWGSSALAALLRVIAFVDEQRSSAAGPAAVAFGPELLGIVAECCSYICALDNSIKGALRVLFYLGLYESLRQALNPLQGFPLDSSWHLRFMAQIYASLGCYWWSSNMWIELWRHSGEVQFFDLGLLAAILCDDLVRMRRLTALASDSAAASEMGKLMRRISLLRLQGSPDAWEEFLFQWRYTKEDVLAATRQETATAQASRDQMLFCIEEQFDLVSKKS